MDGENVQNLWDEMESLLLDTEFTAKGDNPRRIKKNTKASEGANSGPPSSSRALAEAELVSDGLEAFLAWSSKPSPRLSRVKANKEEKRRSTSTRRRSQPTEVSKASQQEAQGQKGKQETGKRRAVGSVECKKPSQPPLTASTASMSSMQKKTRSFVGTNGRGRPRASERTNHEEGTLRPSTTSSTCSPVKPRSAPAMRSSRMNRVNRSGRGGDEHQPPHRGLRTSKSSQSMVLDRGGKQRKFWSERSEAEKAEGEGSLIPDGALLRKRHNGTRSGRSSVGGVASPTRSQQRFTFPSTSADLSKSKRGRKAAMERISPASPIRSPVPVAARRRSTGKPRPTRLQQSPSSSSSKVMTPPSLSASLGSPSLSPSDSPISVKSRHHRPAAQLTGKRWFSSPTLPVKPLRSRSANPSRRKRPGREEKERKMPETSDRTRRPPGKVSPQRLFSIQSVPRSLAPRPQRSKSAALVRPKRRLTQLDEEADADAPVVVVDLQSEGEGTTVTPVGSDTVKLRGAGSFLLWAHAAFSRVAKGMEDGSTVIEGGRSQGEKEIRGVQVAEPSWAMDAETWRAEARDIDASRLFQEVEAVSSAALDRLRMSIAISQKTRKVKKASQETDVVL